MTETHRHNATDRRTEPTNQPDDHAIAARLEVDAATLDRFVTDHPSPSTPAVLGWAEASPEHADAVEAWLDAREERTQARHDRLADEYDTADLETSGPHLFDPEPDEEVGGGSAGGEA